MVSQRWIRWVAIGLVVLVAVGGSVIGALGLAGHDSTGSTPQAAPTALAESTLVLPQRPLGWTAVQGPAVEEARRQAEEFGTGFGARTVYAEYARGRSTLALTGILPAGGTDLRQALEDSPGGAIAHQFVNVGLGEGTPYPSGVPGVSLRCEAPRPGRQACIWADSSALVLMSWRLEGGVARAAELTRALIPAFRRPA
jgi:hypothetical protein